MLFSRRIADFPNVLWFSESFLVSRKSFGVLRSRFGNATAPILSYIFLHKEVQEAIEIGLQEKNFEPLFTKRKKNNREHI
jgi:hypothetical protein